MSQLGSITAEKEKQMDLERQRFQEVKAILTAYKRGRRTINATTIFKTMCPAVLAALLYFCCASIFAFTS